MRVNNTTVGNRIANEVLAGSSQDVALAGNRRDAALAAANRRDVVLVANRGGVVSAATITDMTAAEEGSKAAVEEDTIAGAGGCKIMVIRIVLVLP
mmetsp:Transcript_23596/g.49934  ORF Transcript_23596/g.49934 Transcript_23596/m.49934 type:complete len:96 (+) Transcript_23596:1036-1323(+)